MKPRPPSEPDTPATRAFRRVGWAKLNLRLVRYAMTYLYLPGIDAPRKGVVEALEVVHTLYLKALEGRLDWPLPEDADEAAIVLAACRKLHNMRSALRRSAARPFADGEALDELPDGAPDAPAQLSSRQTIDALVRMFAGDAEASAYLNEILEGSSRAEIAAKLRWSARQVDVVRNRIVRAASARFAEKESSEDEPPSSGPRGSDHVQASEERRRAHAEPHRGPVRAGRRR